MRFASIVTMPILLKVSLTEAVDVTPGTLDSGSALIAPPDP